MIRKNIEITLGQFFKLSMLCLAMVLSFAACNDDTDAYVAPELTVLPTFEENTLSFDQSASYKTLNIKTNRKWRVEIDSDWITADPQSGKPGEYTINIGVKANEGDAREGKISIVTSAITHSYSVIQRGADGSSIEYIGLDKLAEIAADYTQEGQAIEEDYRIRVTVVSDYNGSQFPFKGYHHIMDADQHGLVLTVPKGDKAYEFGTRLTAKLKGCKLSNYNGTVQVEVPNAKTVITGVGEVTPIEATLSEVNQGKYPNALVRIKELQAVEYEDVLLYDGTFSTKRHSIINKQGKTGSMEIYKNASFGKEFMPTGSGTLTAIVVINRSSSGATFYNLRPCAYKDIDFYAPRF